MNQKTPSNNLSAIVLAAGKSARIAPENKLLLPVQGKTIIQKVVEEIIPLKFPEVLVITGFEQDKIKKALQDYPVRLIRNPDYEQGMSASIRLGMLKAKSDIDGYMIFLADMPWIDQNTLKTLIRFFYTNPESTIVVPVFQKRRGNPVIFSKKYENDLLSLDGDSGARPIIKKFQDQVIEVPIPSERLLLDIDTWEDYEN